MGLKSWRKIPISHIETCGERCYSELVKPKLRSGAIKLLTSLKKAGYQLVLISSSHESILKPLSRDLGIDLICTQCETKQGFYTGRLKGEPCFGEGKVRLLRQTFGDVPYIALSDSCSDLPLLKQSERAFAVTPTSALRKQAKAHAWPIILN
jgi:HAD superfamily phosphoserine phosphatase-like hydrolase